MTPKPKPRTDDDYEREERIAIKMDSHIPESDAMQQTDEEAKRLYELF